MNSRPNSKPRGQERGVARIQQLTEECPGVPRHMVIKADVIREGTRPTPALYEVGRWALPDIVDHFVYSYENAGGSAGAGYTPTAMYLKNGTSIKVMLNSDSPYEVRYEGRGAYRLYRDGDPLEEVRFGSCPDWYWKPTSNGKIMHSVLGLADDRWPILYNTYCEYFKDGNQCWYCNLNPTREHLAELGEERLPVKREQDIYETFIAAAQETGVDGMSMSGGAFIDRKKEADLFIRNMEILKRAMKDSGYKVTPAAMSQAMEEEDWHRLKEAGFSSFNCSLEVWDPRLFEIICPGKAKYVGREHWIECSLRGAEIFGWGHMAINFVLGIEAVPPHGFKSEDEAAESALEGFQFFASRGAVPTTIPFRSVPGARMAQAQRPRTEYILRVEQERFKLLKEYNLLPKVAPGSKPRSTGFSISGDWAYLSDKAAEG